MSKMRSRFLLFPGPDEDRRDIDRDVGKPRDHGLLLGFAAWRESEISAAVRTMASCF